jgi:hypothetical protein
MAASTETNWPLVDPLRRTEAKGEFEMHSVCRIIILVMLKDVISFCYELGLRLG